MIIFLYGQDSYRSKQKLDEIIDHYKKVRKSTLNLIYADAGEMDFSDFYNNFKISPMFAESKLVVVKNLFADKKFQEEFVAEVKNLEKLKDVIVIYEAQEVDQRLKLFKSLLKECKSQESKALDTRGIKMWAQKEFEGRGVKINGDALDLLVSYVGADMWRLSSEIKKLTDFKSGAVVRKDDVLLQVKPTVESDIFKTIDALAAKDKKQALRFLQRHLDNGESPLYVLSMIAYQFKNLLMVKELAEKGLMYNSIMQRSGLHPFVVKKTYFQCSQFSFGELKRIYHDIFNTDTDIKTGKIEPETALHLLMSRI